MSDTYTSKSIKRMSDVDHIRHSPGMYMGSTEDVTHLFIECLDNALDEVNAGHAKSLVIKINNKDSIFSISDDGRGIPIDLTKTPDEDTPALISTKARTSGKFKKAGDSKSAYSIAIGTHGYGLSVVYALSEYVKFVIKNKKDFYEYDLLKNGDVSRTLVNSKHNFSTMIEFSPTKKYFEKTKVNVEKISERILIAKTYFEKLNVEMIILENDEEIKIKFPENAKKEIIEKSLSNNTSCEWFEFNYKNELSESFDIAFTWDLDDNTTSRYFSSVNLVKVDSGYHETLINNVIKTNLMKLAQKLSLDIKESDCLNWFRCFVQLRIIESKFESQTKEKLSRNSNLEIMNDFEKDFIANIKKNSDYYTDLLNKIHEYRQSLHNKKIIKNASTKRGSSSFTNLKDCTGEHGELLIGEGESAVSGLIKVRDPKRHAILPLRGVIPNIEKKVKISELIKNEVISDIIISLGCGITPNCDIKKLRYSKIILASDADPAGEFICTLLLTLFSKLFSEVVKNGNLFICRTPLFGVGYGDDFVPIWGKTELDEARKNNKKIRRFKGLGEFNPNELKRFTLDVDTRRIIRMDWSSDINSLFDLLSSNEKRKELITPTIERDK